jgi:hypothetical protein
MPARILAAHRKLAASSQSKINCRIVLPPALGPSPPSMHTLFPAPCTLPLASCLIFSLSRALSATYIIAISSVCNCPLQPAHCLIGFSQQPSTRLHYRRWLLPRPRLHACTPANHRAPVTLCHFLIRRTPHLDLDACTDKT